MLTPGEVLDGRYEILELLARGGMGAVYRARRILLGDDVAVKVLSTPDDASLRERFLRESRAAAQLRHPHIVGVLDYDVDAQGHPFLVMEYLNGPSLLQRVALDRQLPVEEVLDIAGALCGALQLAHTAGVVHRDLKPANVVSHEYMPGHFVYKVVDFGLVNVREIAGALKLTLDRQFLGTVAYASPEQLRGEVVDARSDIYSFCAMLYELLTGRPPFDHDDPFVVITKHLTREPQPLRDLMPAIPAALEAVVLQGLAKDPAHRPASMEALAKALRASVGPDPDKTWITTSARWRRRARAPGPGGARLRARGPDQQGTAGQPDLPRHAQGARHRRSPSACCAARTSPTGMPRASASSARRARCRSTTRTSSTSGTSVKSRVTCTWSPTSSSARACCSGWPTTARCRGRVLERLTSQLIDGVAALHRRGAFICGITPLTTRLTEEDGEERLLVSSGGVSQVQDLLGTASEGALRGTELRESELPYVAPEVLMGEAPTVAGDLFTIGAIVYTMATGSPPFLAPSLPQLLGAMLRERPEALAAIRADIPQSFSDAIMKTLSPVPAERPADARALALTL